ncbi:MAG: DUF423 domain-containing protein [Bdellovibrionales bacterium]|nr:DUF423 domain-containing protein [Bdellovibrionales bacterium]
MAKCFLALSGLFGFFSVALGAFGAHALKEKLDAYQMGVFKTGVEYQFFHALAIALVGVLLLRGESTLLKSSGYAFIFGVLVFSGSLYLLVFTGQRWWGAITPIGGMSFLIAWALFALGCYRMS